MVQSCPGFGWTSMVMLTAVVSLGAVLAWVTYARRKDQVLQGSTCTGCMV